RVREAREHGRLREVHDARARGHARSAPPADALDAGPLDHDHLVLLEGLRGAVEEGAGVDHDRRGRGLLRLALRGGTEGHGEQPQERVLRFHLDPPFQASYTRRESFAPKTSAALSAPGRLSFPLRVQTAITQRAFGVFT